MDSRLRIRYRNGNLTLNGHRVPDDQMEKYREIFEEMDIEMSDDVSFSINTDGR